MGAKLIAHSFAALVLLQRGASTAASSSTRSNSGGNPNIVNIIQDLPMTHFLTLGSHAHRQQCNNIIYLYSTDSSCAHRLSLCFVWQTLASLSWPRCFSHVRYELTRSFRICRTVRILASTLDKGSIRCTYWSAVLVMSSLLPSSRDDRRHGTDPRNQKLHLHVVGVWEGLHLQPLALAQTEQNMVRSLHPGSLLRCRVRVLSSKLPVQSLLQPALGGSGNGRSCGDGSLPLTRHHSIFAMNLHRPQLPLAVP